MILAAIEKSDGSRRSVRDALFNGDGFMVTASQSLLNKYVRVDTKTGDVIGGNISVMRIEDTKEVFIKDLP